MNIFMSDVMNRISGLIIPIFPAFKLESSNERAITKHTYKCEFEYKIVCGSR